MRYSGYRGAYDNVPNTCCDVPVVYDYNTGIQYGSSIRYDNERNGRHEIDASVTHYTDDFLGASHDWKLGIEYEDSWTVYQYNYTGGGAVFLFPYYGYTYLYGYTNAAHIEADVERSAAYLQDDVAVSDHLTFNLGLRYDNPRISDAYDGPGGNPKQLTSYGFVAPRIGVSADLTGVGRYVAHASWGRYHEKPLSWGPVRNGGVGAEPHETYVTIVPGEIDVDSVGTQQIAAMVFDPANLQFSFAHANLPIDADLAGPHTDVLNVGFEAEVARGYVLGIDFVHKRDRNFVFGQDRQRHTYEPVQHTDPLGGTQTLYTRTDSHPNDPWVTNSDYYFRRHNMAILSFEKRPSRGFNLSTSITYQRSTGNIENHVGTAWGVRGLGDTSPNFNGHPYSVGRLTFSRDWQFKALANYRLPGGILAGGYFRWMTGRPWSPLARQNTLPQPLNEFVPLTLEPAGLRIQRAHQKQRLATWGRRNSVAAEPERPTAPSKGWEPPLRSGRTGCTGPELIGDTVSTTRVMGCSTTRSGTVQPHRT